MLYAILCYNDETVVESWSKEKDAAVIAARGKVTDRLAARGRLGPVARLMPTTAATTIRTGKSQAGTSGQEQFVLDGPFAETKEQLLGFYVVEADSLDEVVAIAREMKADEPGAFEIRPLRVYMPGSLKTESAAP
ncbi:MAG TPA: YciI family protein [Ferrovibrio sp.]|uniref:YciI family protein n=1 Tax=Ferrovibrio sp. TaxID=1917215 RepID=UPI002ED01C1F